MTLEPPDKLILRLLLAAQGYAGEDNVELLHWGKKFNDKNNDIEYRVEFRVRQQHVMDPRD